MELIKYITENIENLSIEQFMYFYNDINIEILNDSDRNIYTLDELEENIESGMFTDIVTGNLLRNILYGNADVNNDYFYWDSYIHLQSINYADIKEKFIFEIKDTNMFDMDMLKEVRVYLDSYI